MLRISGSRGSGDPKPSPDDIEMTKEIREATD
jgi:DNA repair protein RadC